MSKEEALLEVVLDNFANIMKVLNATKDIENFLVKLKLKKKRGIGVILEKTKILVDSLYDHSIKTKEEFYKHYDALEELPTEKEQENESNDNTAEIDVASTVEENNISNTIGELTCNNSVTSNETVEEVESDNASNIINKDASDEIPIEENNETEKHEENNCDSTMEEKDNSDINNSEEDPLKDIENSDVIDSSIINTNKDTMDIEEESLLTDENKDSENQLQVTEDKKAIIRLVDLSKLMDSKPKKSVKFDSSVIVLTSSDEETKTPKKNCDTKNQNCALKSALKNSPDKGKTVKHRDKYDKITGDKESQKKKHLRSSKPSRHKHNDSDSEQSKASSSDSEILRSFLNKSERERKGKNRNKKRLSDKNENSSDSDVLEVHSENENESRNCETRFERNFQENKDNISDTEELNEKSSQKKQKSLKKSESNDNSGSINTLNSSDSECNENNLKNNEYSSKTLRKSSRIDIEKNIKQNARENLKKIFKRKSSRSGRSNFEIIGEKSKKDNGISDSDTESTRKRKSRKRKDYLEKHNLSMSSSSDDERDVLIKEKSKIKTKDHKTNVECSVRSSINDEKFSYAVYIPLPQIECSQLQEVYLRNKEILEVKSLTKINLRGHKRTGKAKNNSESSSETEKPKSKKLKKNYQKNAPETSEDDQTTDDEPLIKSTNNLMATHSEKTTGNKDEEMANIIMDKLKESDEEKKCEESNSDAEEKEEKSENNKIKEHEISEGKDKDNNLKKVDDEDTIPCDIENEKKTDNESDDEIKKSKKKWRSDKLLTSKIDSTDSEEEFSKYCKKKEKPREEIMSDAEDRSSTFKKRKVNRRIKNLIVSSDSETDKDKKNDKESNSDEAKCSDDEKSSSSDSSERKGKTEKTPARRRIKRTKESSSDDDKSTRKQIRRLIGKDALSETTLQAEAEEKERKARILEKQKKYNNIFQSKADSKVEKVVLDYDEKKKKELLSVHKKIVKKLKPHQGSGVQFMWDACFESLERVKSNKGSGCILAHCMGLGKTLQVIALAHTLLTNSEKTGVNKIMVVCPINTVLNWKAEFKLWMPDEDDFEVYELVSCKQNYERQYVVQGWHRDGGVLIIGYHMFRNLSNPDNKRISKKLRKSFQDGLVDPGPDLVVCDEGHLLKNEKTHLSIAMNRIRTARRIVLTGTPLQNNLKEYWCMVQFIKPNLLGTYKEYLNRFVNPITNGQYTDSTQHDILLMRKRSHVLHKLLDGVVQRRDYAVLEPYLPPKHEYVLFISLTETQVKLYEYYMERFARQSTGSNRTSFLFTDFQNLQRICTHPRVLLDKSNERREKEDDDDGDEEESEGSLKDFINDRDESTPDSSSSSSNSDSDNSSGNKKENKKQSQQKVRVTRALAAQRGDNVEIDLEIEEVKKEWWQEFCDGDELNNINNSGKLFLLFQILKECEEIGDKVLVFSQSLYTLNCIEYFLDKIDEATQTGNTEKVGGHTGAWSIGLDYFRLDGSSSCDNRAAWCDMFNNPKNTRARLFLISTKAGGLGINLVAANRVIIFDVSWNPSHDIQSIYRVYRFGQTKPSYIYRFVTYGTMEMKIYERQVTKQAISKRVIDEQQIDRHYNQNDLQELYRCDLQPTERPIPLVPKDVLLGEMLQKYDKTIFKYHLHQSLLENKTDEGLNEEERKAAWEEFENEKVLRKNTLNSAFGNNAILNAHAIEAALASIVRKDNPTWSDVQIKGIIPALVQQLQVQLSEGDMTMYSRVQQEMQLMQALHAQKLKEAYYQQQVMRMIQQQQQQAKMIGNLNIDPAQLARTQANIFNNLLAGHRQGGPSSGPLQRPQSNEVIELND